ncbi:uncharacterized protein LOC115624952 [Scaptodrosophila lebanonensis]|uniref:Uncharacterized protein LOC115624952 n=1 Tax=Drosophila lebanonensis TaxID=7225 RepID=A0A6J2TI13_DROLE|nr:uncharacterized protein LOC115624952 [Scaptodrosophila lebanonensis]
MPVAVRLVEALTLITIMALIACVSLTVIVAQRTIFIAVTLLEPAVTIANILLIMTEKVLVGALLCMVTMINTVSNAIHSTGVA